MATSPFPVCLLLLCLCLEAAAAGWPRGMDKLIETENGATITNDGATVLQLLQVQHPAAALLVDVAQSQDLEVGDGTTSVVVLAGEFLQEAKTFIEEGMAPQIIVKGLRAARDLALKRISEVEESTRVAHALRGDLPELEASMVVDAVSALGPSLDISMLGVKKQAGGSYLNSRLVRGVAFKKTFSYAGFEQQPKKLHNPKILLLNLELELKAEKENAEIRLDNPDDYQSIVDAEWTIIYEKLQAIVDSGAQVVFSKLPIVAAFFCPSICLSRLSLFSPAALPLLLRAAAPCFNAAARRQLVPVSFVVSPSLCDLATQFFADRNIFCAGRVEEADLKRAAKATGAKIQTTVMGLTPDVLGTCGLFEEDQVGSERYNILSDCPQATSVTLLLRGGAPQFLDEAERSLNDAVMIVRRALKSHAIVAGGGAIEMELSRYLREQSKLIAGKQQLVMLSFARALEAIPRALTRNGGFDATDVLNKLRQKHAASSEVCWVGVDCINGGVTDAMAAYVWEPSLVKQHAIAAATEAACLILSIDETITQPNPDNKKGGPGGR
ncbi:hypothetical protein Emed_002226 [Eimeria media]